MAPPCLKAQTLQAVIDFLVWCLQQHTKAIVSNAYATIRDDAEAVQAVVNFLVCYLWQHSKVMMSIVCTAIMDKAVNLFCATTPQKQGRYTVLVTCPHPDTQFKDNSCTLDNSFRLGLCTKAQKLTRAGTQRTCSNMQQMFHIQQAM